MKDLLQNFFIVHLSDSFYNDLVRIKASHLMDLRYREYPRGNYISAYDQEGISL